jgi:hypothetical protein
MLNDRDFEKIREIANAANGPIGQQLAILQERMDGHVEQTEEHHHTLYGNGTPGLVKNVDRLLQGLASSTWLWRIVLTAIVVEAIGGGTAAAIWLIVRMH